MVEPSDDADMRTLRCFQHCRKDVNIVCFRLPAHCPLCGADTAETPCRIPPYALPAPFVSSAAAPRSVIVRPTLGSFISHYTFACDLHIGLTDSSGHVTEFDERGLTVGSLWPQCLVVVTCPPPPLHPFPPPPLSSPAPASPPAPAQQTPDWPSIPHQAPPSSSNLLHPRRHHAPPGTIRPTAGDSPTPHQHASAAWDSALTQLRAGEPGRLWDSSRYNEQTWNCFDLVLHFLLQQLPAATASLSGGWGEQLVLSSDLDLASLAENDDRRAQFCDHYLVRKCRRAEEFVHLYRQICANGFACVPRQQQATSS